MKQMKQYQTLNDYLKIMRTAQYFEQVARHTETTETIEIVFTNSK